MASSPVQERVFIGPGISPFKRILTYAGVLAITCAVLWIAIHEGTPAIGIRSRLFCLSWASLSSCVSLHLSRLPLNCNQKL